MCISSQRNTKGPRQAKVRQFQVTLTINQEILGFKVPVEDAVAVAITDSLDKLGHELLDHCLSKTQIGAHHRAIRQGFSTATLADRKSLHVLLEVEVKEFKDQVQLVAVCMHDIEEAYDIWVIHLFEQRNLANCGAGNAFIFGFEANLLQRDNTVGMVEFAGFVDDTVSTYRWSVGVSLDTEILARHWDSPLRQMLCTHTLSNFLDLLIVLHGDKRCWQ